MVHAVHVEETYRGPLDLLLHLVKRDEIDIHDIPIAHLTREYLRELDTFKEDLDIDLASEFIAMASMLVEIKSRMLLPPSEAIEGDDEEETFDPREGLVRALLEYKRFKEAASALGELADTHARRIARLAPVPSFESEEEETIEEASGLDLLVAFQNLIRTMLQNEAQEIVSDEVPTEVRIEQILETVAHADYTTFSKLLSSRPTKGEMVGFFIAILELVRLRKVRARQTEDFRDIHIERYDAGEAPILLHDESRKSRTRPSRLVPSGPTGLFPAILRPCPVKGVLSRPWQLFSTAERALDTVTRSLQQQAFLPMPGRSRAIVQTRCAPPAFKDCPVEEVEAEWVAPQPAPPPQAPPSGSAPRPALRPRRSPLALAPLFSIPSSPSKPTMRPPADFLMLPRPVQRASGRVRVIPRLF